jgi:hypothetical protein
MSALLSPKCTFEAVMFGLIVALLQSASLLQFRYGKACHGIYQRVFFRVPSSMIDVKDHLKSLKVAGAMAPRLITVNAHSACVKSLTYYVKTRLQAFRLSMSAKNMWE